jgi:hypothetical protein
MVRVKLLSSNVKQDIQRDIWNGWMIILDMIVLIIWGMEIDMKHSIKLTDEIIEQFKQENKIDWENTGITNKNYTQNIERQWNTETELYLKLTINNISWFNQLDVICGDYELNISENLSNWDILIIDTYNSEVLLNWVSIKFIWTLPNLDLINNNLQINFDCSSVNYDLYYSHNPAFY